MASAANPFHPSDWSDPNTALYISSICYAPACMFMLAAVVARARIEAGLMRMRRPWLRLLQVLLCSLALRGCWFAVTASGLTPSKCLTGFACTSAILLTGVNRLSQMLFFTGFAIVAAHFTRVARMSTDTGAGQSAGPTPAGDRVVSCMDLTCLLLSVWLIVLQAALLGVSFLFNLDAVTANHIYDTYIIQVALMHVFLSAVYAYATVRSWSALTAAASWYESEADRVILTAGVLDADVEEDAPPQEPRKTANAWRHAPRALQRMAAAMIGVGRPSAHGVQRQRSAVMRIPLPSHIDTYVHTHAYDVMEDGQNRHASPVALKRHRSVKYATVATTLEDARAPLLSHDDDDADEGGQVGLIQGGGTSSAASSATASLASEYRSLSQRIRGMRWSITYMSGCMCVCFCVRSVMFLWRPVSNTSITGLAGAITYPWAFYTIPEILPSLVIAWYVALQPLLAGCSCSRGKCRYSGHAPLEGKGAALASDVHALDAVTTAAVVSLLRTRGGPLQHALEHAHVDVLRQQQKRADNALDDAWVRQQSNDVYAGRLDEDA